MRRPLLKRLAVLWKDTRVGPDGTSLDSGDARIRRVALLLLLITGPTGLLALYYRNMFPGLTFPDALDFAQLGRNIAEGKGFTTYWLRPLALRHDLDLTRQPDLINGPLYPLLLAIAFAIRGAKDSTVAAVSGFFYLATVPVVYRLGLRIFNPAVALVSAMVFSLNALMLEYAASGTHYTLAVFLSTCLFLQFYELCIREQTRVKRIDERLPRYRLCAVGLISGLLYLTDPLLVWLLPVSLAFVLMVKTARPLQAFLWVAGSLLLVITPWISRNLLLGADPFFGTRSLELFMQTDTHPGINAYRLDPGEIQRGSKMVTEVAVKVLRSAGQVVQTYPTVTGSWLLAFFLPALLFRVTNRSANTLRGFILCFSGAALWGMLLFRLQLPLFVCAIPAMMVFAIAYLMHLIGEARLNSATSGLLTAMAATLVVLPLIYDVTLRTPRLPALPQMQAARALEQVVDRNEVVFSDQPWIVAWYGHRPSVWAPSVGSNVENLRKRHAQIRWLFLTDQVRVFSSDWQRLFDIFMRWSILANVARDAGEPPPGAMRVAARGRPLYDALAGFETRLPLVPGTPSAVLASAPKTAPRGAGMPGSDRGSSSVASR